MEEIDVMSEETDVEDYAENTANPLVYVVTTLVVTAVSYAGYRYWQSRRRKNRLALVESLPAQEDESESK